MGRLPKPKEGNKRRCKICDSEFIAFPSSNAHSCSSPKCRKAMRSNSVRRHGESGDRLHNIWAGMKTRCLHIDRYMHLSVCAEWNSYECFRDWALAHGYDDSLEIDRKDNSKGYCPDNCRWATRKQQMQNTGIRKLTNKTSQYKGVQYLAHTRKHWRALASVNGKPKQLGLFDTEIEAAAAYDKWAKSEYGDFCSLNIKEE